MLVRVLQEHDLEVIKKVVEIEAEAFGSGGMNEWHLVPFIRHGCVFILLMDNDIVGSAQYMLDWHQPKKAYMYGISILAKSRGKGLGTVLLQESFRQLADMGIEQVELTVDPRNTSAVKVYQEKMGFAVAGFRHDEYGEGEDRIVMDLAINNYRNQSKIALTS